MGTRVETFCFHRINLSQVKVFEVKFRNRIYIIKQDFEDESSKLNLTLCSDSMISVWKICLKSCLGPFLLFLKHSSILQHNILVAEGYIYSGWKNKKDKKIFSVFKVSLWNKSYFWYWFLPRFLPSPDTRVSCDSV